MAARLFTSSWLYFSDQGDAGHAGAGDELAHVLVVVHQDSQVHHVHAPEPAERTTASTAGV